MISDPAESTIEERLTIASRPASAREKRLGIVLVGMLAIASLLAWPFHRHAFSSATSFIPAFAGTTGMADALGAVLLLGLYLVDGSRAVRAVATAYLVNAFLILPYALTFPGVIDRFGFLGNEQSAAWLWITWHCAFPVIVIVGCRSMHRIRAERDRMRDVVAIVAGAAAFAFVAAVVVTLGKGLLPVLVHNGEFASRFTAIAIVGAAINAAAVAVVLRADRPLRTLWLWVAVAATASVLDMLLNAISPARFSAAWYVGKAETFVTASIVLVSLLGAWSSLYARTTSLAQKLSASLSERLELEEDLERERRVSITLQEASLPRTLPHVDRVALHAAYHPGSDEATIGGDWYDAFPLGDGRLALTIGDVLGNGLRAAITMSKLRQAMQTAAMMLPEPLLMLQVADETLQLHDPGGYATAIAAIYDPVAHETIFASAGHLCPIVRDPDGRVVDHDTNHGLMLGVNANAVRRVETIATPPGSTLVLYTDGLVEATRDLFAGTNRLSAAIADTSIMNAPDPAAAIVAAVLAGKAATDDIAVLTVGFIGSAAPGATDGALARAPRSQAARP